jgi:hypothetical protein
MTGELTIFKTGATPSLKFKGADLPTQRLDDGVSAGFARVSYKGSKWGIRYQGAYTPIQARMPDGTVIQSPFLDVVILCASGHPNKAWYAGAYSEGETSTPPDCWSSNGFAPDAGAPNKQSKTCLGCPHNVWGSKINRDTGLASKGKACMDSKRLAVVPVGDINNVTYGGPMMLSVPPSSLKRLGPYQNLLEANGFHYAAVWTRVTFDGETSYPLFNFDAIAALSDPQADQVLTMVKHPMIDRILDAEQSTVEAWDESAQSVHSSIVAGATQAQPAQPTPTPTPAGPTAEQIDQANADAQEAAAAARMQAAMDASRAETARKAQEAAAAAAAAAAAKAIPMSGPADPGPIPAALVRTPVSAPAPSVEPVTEAPEPQAEQPEFTLPPGVTLPPGMTPEMAAQFMAHFGAQAQAPKRGRRARTPPVSPTGPSVAGTGQPAMAMAGQPQAAAPVSPTPAANGAAGADAISQIMGTIGKLV